MGNVRKNRDNILVTTERRRNYLVSEPNHYTKKFFTEYLLDTERKKTQILMNKPVYLRPSVLELSKVWISGLWYDYIKPKYGEKAKSSYRILTVSLYR